MANLNKIMLIGRAGQDPQVRTFTNNDKVANLTLAVSERYNNRQGELVENTTWFNLVFSGKLADIVEQFVHKGDLLYVEGKVRNRKYIDANNFERSISEVVCNGMQMFSAKKEEDDKKEQKAASAQVFPDKLQKPAAMQVEMPDDDLPFC